MKLNKTVIFLLCITLLIPGCLEDVTPSNNNNSSNSSNSSSSNSNNGSKYILTTGSAIAGTAVIMAVIFEIIKNAPGQEAESFRRKVSSTGGTGTTKYDYIVSGQKNGKFQKISIGVRRTKQDVDYTYFDAYGKWDREKERWIIE